MFEIAFAILLITLLIALALEESKHAPQSHDDDDERRPEWW